MKTTHKWIAAVLAVASVATLTAFTMKNNGAVPPQENANDVPMVADAAMYRGNVTGIVKQSGDRALLVLEQAAGTDFGYPTFTVRVTKDTVKNCDLDKIVEDKAYVEVMYGVSGGAGKPAQGGDTTPPDAISLKLLPETQFSVYNGEVVEVMSGFKDTKMSLLMKTIGGTEEEVIFHVSDETQIYMNEADIKPGTKLNLFTTGVRTMSIPAQGSALEIRPYHAPQAETTETIVD